eukprot:gene2901-3333_t
MASTEKRVLNLPDIDSSLPDSFETPDVPEIPSASSVDFSDSIYRKPIRRTGSSFAGQQTEFDIAPTANADETPLQRYQRLQFEVRTFREEMQIIADAGGEVEPGIKGVDLTHQLADLQGQLSLLLENEKLRPILDENRQVLHYSQIQGDSSKMLMSEIKAFTDKTASATEQPASSESATANNHVKYELFYTGDQAKYQQLQRLTDLDKRLAQLETLIGNKTELSIPLTQTMVEIKEKLALLDSTKLDVLQQKMKSAVKQMEQLKQQDNSATKSLTTNETKINEIFELMNRWDTVGQQIPSIINRLYTLRSLHEEGLALSNHVGNLEKDQAGITSLLKTNSSLMNKMDESFKGNMTTIQSNIESLEKRITDISSKMNK